MQLQRYLVLIAAMTCSILSAQNKERPGSGSGIRIENAMQINTIAPDFSPAFYANGLVFVSSRLKGGMVDASSGQTYFELFYAPFNQEGVPQKAKLFSLEVNSALHEGPVTFDRGENSIFFTRSNQVQGVSKADKTGRVVLKIYQAVRGLYDWEHVTELPFNRDSFSCMHPALSPDGNRLFFASNMPGGYGGMDIYMVDRDGDSWLEPVNLGPEINTAREEAFPFMHESGVLFFASNGHRGAGGMDLYSIDIGSARWGQLRNLEVPINSSADDFGIIITPDGKKGYFSSNRKEGKGKDDIYLFETPNGLQGILEPEVYTLRLNVLDISANYPAAGAGVYIFERAPDGQILNDSAYSVEVAAADGDFALRMTRKPVDKLGQPQMLTGRMGDAVLQLQPYRNYVILVVKEGYKTVEIPFLPQVHDMTKPLKIELERNNCSTIRGITRDAAGSPISNVRVRIVNGCTRQEEQVVSDAKGNYTYCADPGCNYTLIGEKPGLESYKAQLSLINAQGGSLFELDLKLGASVSLAGTSPVGAGTIIVLDNIYYDFNKTVIRSGQARDLEALARLMSLYPSMEIELGAHTDSRGAADYNLTLSQERAESAKAFLLSRGIASERIKAVGYGESRPRNGCIDGVDCSESEYQFNRRTEVKVLKINEPIPVLPTQNER